MAGANPLWGAPRIHGELRKLGIEISERTVSRLLAQLSRPPSQPWRTFLANHLSALVRRECLDHVIILNHRHLRRLLLAYLAYYHRSRTHLGLSKDAPDGRPVCAAGQIIVSPEVGGLHHRYDRQAA